jgi:hypothetical protein
MFLGSKVRRVHRTDNLAAILNISQPYRPPRPATGISLLLLTEMSTRNRKIMLLVSRARQVRRADNLTAICEPIVYTMWNPQHLTTL